MFAIGRITVADGRDAADVPYWAERAGRLPCNKQTRPAGRRDPGRPIGDPRPVRQGDGSKTSSQASYVRDPREDGTLGKLMQGLRSRAFDAVLVLWTAMFLPALAVLLICGRPASPIRATSRVWAKGILLTLKWTVGLTHTEIGRQNIPTGPCLIVANHQSQWETIAFLILVPNVAIVAKQELLAIPVMGWFLRHSPMIVVDRDKGGSALRLMLAEARSALDQGRPVLIFPQGRRSSAASSVEFKRGVGLLYGQLGVPVLPVALDSGLFWTADRRHKRRGSITVSYLAPIQPGLPGAEFVRRVERAVQDALRGPGGAAPEMA